MVNKDHIGASLFSCFRLQITVLDVFRLFCHLHHNRTFHSLSEQFAAVSMNSGNASRCMVGVCSTSAGAIQLCPAGFAILSSISIAKLKFIAQSGIRHTVPHIAHAVFRVAHKLMTREQLAPRGHR